MRNVRLAATAIVAASVIVGPAWAQDARLVELDKSSSIHSYWDLNSVKPVGDGFDLQLVDISYSYSYSIIAGSTDVTVKLSSYQQGIRISCGWRTVQYAVRDNVDQGGGVFRPADEERLSAPSFLSPDKPYGRLAELMCGGDHAAQSGLTQAQAEAEAEARLVKDKVVPPPIMLRQATTLDAPPWAARAHRFEPLPLAPGALGRTYLDALSMVRQGGEVETVALAALPSPGRADLRAHAAEMRSTRYDCRRKTLTVQSSAVWNGYGGLVRVEEKPAPPRAAAQSPAIAAEIEAACGSFKADGAPAIDALAAIAANQEDALSPRAWKISCVWDGLTPDQRVPWIDMWDGRDRNVFPELRGGELLVAKGCGATSSEVSVAAQALRQRAIQYGVTQRLIDRYGALFEQRTLAAWNALPEMDRRRFAQPWRDAATSEREFQTTLILRMAKTIGLKSRDDVMLLAQYLKSQAALQVEMRVPT